MSALKTSALHLFASATLLTSCATLEPTTHQTVEDKMHSFAAGNPISVTALAFEEDKDMLTFSYHQMINDSSSPEASVPDTALSTFKIQGADYRKGSVHFMTPENNEGLPHQKSQLFLTNLKDKTVSPVLLNGLSKPDSAVFIGAVKTYEAWKFAR